METTQRHYRVDRREIGFLKFIFEAYDGIAVLTTTDARRGMVMMQVAPGCEDVVDSILQDLKKGILIEPAGSPEGA